MTRTSLSGQLQLLFLLFHNRVVEHFRHEQPALDGDHLFEEAQRLVRWHYQWMVVHDFLGRIVGRDVIDDIIKSNSVHRCVPTGSPAWITSISASTAGNGSRTCPLSSQLALTASATR